MPMELTTNSDLELPDSNQSQYVTTLANKSPSYESVSQGHPELDNKTRDMPKAIHLIDFSHS